MECLEYSSLYPFSLEFLKLLRFWPLCDLQYIIMLWFNFILGLNFISLCFEGPVRSLQNFVYFAKKSVKMEAISSANDLFHQPRFSQVSPKLSSKMPWSKFGGLQFLIRQRKSFLPWQLFFVGSSYFANMITVLFQLLFLSCSFGIKTASPFIHPRIHSKIIPEFRRQLAKSTL